MPAARLTDPQTSHEAAASVSNIGPTRAAILRLLQTGMSDQLLVDSIRVLYGTGFASESGIRSRRAELVALGLVKDTGIRVRTASGRKAIVWTVA